MRFCKICDNMYYIKLNDDTKTSNLEYYCRNCGHVDTELSVENISVSKQFLKNKDKQFDNIINQYTKFDPTLPRIHNILCPNQECATNIVENMSSASYASSVVEREIIYIRYDDVNIKYLYLCTTCDHSWKIEDS